MKLEAGEAGNFGEALQRFGSFVHHYADFLHGRWKLADDRSGGFGRDLARALGQDEAERVGSGIERGAGVVEIGGAADLDPEHGDSFRFRVSSFKSEIN